MVIQSETAFENRKSAIEAVTLMMDRKVVGEFNAIRPSIDSRRMPSVEMKS